MNETLLLLAARGETRRELRAQGKSFGEAFILARSVTSDMLHAARASLPPDQQTAMTGAIGDGTIISAIIEFLKSPLGQALIQAIIALLIL